MENTVELQPSAKQQIPLPQQRFSTKYFFPNLPLSKSPAAKPIFNSGLKTKNALQQTQTNTEQTIISEAPLLSRLRSASFATKEKFRSILLSLLSLFKSSRMDPRGEAALSQLKYLASLCMASSCLSNDEMLLFNAAFGEAYYNISQCAKNPNSRHKTASTENSLRYYSSFKNMLRSLE